MSSTTPGGSAAGHELVEPTVEPTVELTVDPSSAAHDGDFVLAYRAHSETGPRRSNNQDAGHADPHLLLVADGMGGAAAGDLASAIAVHVVLDAVESATESATLFDVLAPAVDAANEKIADVTAADPTLEGMGTTASALLFNGRQMAMAHIGDSRIYRFRDGRLDRLSHDHSWVQTLVDDGRITEDEAASHPNRNLVMKVLNGHHNAEPDLALVTLREGDRLLLCSDGLSGMTTDAAMARALAEPDLDIAMSELVALAYRGGGSDNITIVLADVRRSGGTTEPVSVGSVTDVSVPDVPRRGDVEPADPGAEPMPVRTEDDLEESRYSPRETPRRWWLRPLLAIVLALALAGAAVAGGVAWLRTQYYVGTDAGTVAIYRGLHDRVLGVPLSRLHEKDATRVADLPAYMQAQLTATIDSANLADAEGTVAELRAAAGECLATRAQGGTC